MIISNRGLAWPIPALLGASVALAGCGSTPAAPPTPPAPSAQPQANEDPDADHHRRRVHGGVTMLIALSIKDLDLSADQKTKVEAIRTDLHAKMEPAHAAHKELAGVLADGVAAGAVDRAKADAAIDKLVAAVEATQAASQDALNQLHAALTPPQRAALVEKLAHRGQKWKDAHGEDDQHRRGPPRGGMGFGKELGLTDDQRAKIQASLKDMMTKSAGPPPHDHKEVNDHVQSFAVAFKSDTFDAKTLGNGGKAASHMARFGALHLARFCEAAAPVLTPEQRTKLAQHLRERSAQKD